MTYLDLTIATPSGVIYQAQVEQVTVTTQSGEITILPQHIPLVSHLTLGHVMVRKNGKESYFAIDGGILEVRDGHSVIVLANSSERAEDIDYARAEEAMRKAENYMKNPTEFGFDYHKLQEILRREENRMRIAKKGHRK